MILNFFKVSTGETDKNGDFLDKGPSLSFNYSNNQASLSLQAGITMLDVALSKTSIKYIPSAAAFQVTLTYPRSFLGVKNPSISFSWSKQNGFQITNWSLPNPLLPNQFDQELFSQIKNWLAQATEKSCSGLVDLVFDKVIKSEFDIALSTAHKSKWEDGDVFAFKVGGTYNISIGGKVKIVSVQLPDIIVHLPSVQNMDGVGKYIIHTLIANADSMAKQLVQQPEHLVKLLAAIALKKLGKKALIAVVNSLICREVDKDDIEKQLTDEFSECVTAVEDAGGEMATLLAEFATYDVYVVGSSEFLAMAACAVDLGADALGIGIIVGGIIALSAALVFIGYKLKKDIEKYKKKEKEAKEKSKAAQQKVEKLLKISPPIHVTVCNEVLSVSWQPLPQC